MLPELTKEQWDVLGCDDEFGGIFSGCIESLAVLVSRGLIRQRPSVWWCASKMYCRTEAGEAEWQKRKNKTGRPPGRPSKKKSGA